MASRDPFLDNCKFALILLIGIGHGLQWLLAQEDSRTARGWCAVEGEVGDDGKFDAPRASSLRRPSRVESPEALSRRV